MILFCFRCCFLCHFWNLQTFNSSNGNLQVEYFLFRRSIAPGAVHPFSRVCQQSTMSLFVIDSQNLAIFSPDCLAAQPRCHSFMPQRRPIIQIMPVNHESLPIEPFFYRRVVKSISLAGLYPPSEAFSQVQPPEHNTLAPTSKLLYGTTLLHTSRSRATGTGRSGDGRVFRGSSVAGAFTGRSGAARAARSRDGVLAGSLGACAVKSRLLAARAGSLLGWRRRC